MFFNRQQIIEQSDGEEGLFSGDSEYRKVTLVLMITWFPFPIWFFLTPEGIGLVDDIVVVQMGWACLNIVSKFTMIFFIQRVKDNYWFRAALARDLKLKNVLADGWHQNMDDMNTDEDLALSHQPSGDQPGMVQVPAKGMQGQVLTKQVLDSNGSVKGSVKGSADGNSADGSTTVDLEPLTSKLEQLETMFTDKFVEVTNNIAAPPAAIVDHDAISAGVNKQLAPELAQHIQYSTELIREKVGSGLQDLGKLFEKMTSMLEVKMELAFAAQNKENQTVQKEIRDQLKEWPEILFNRMDNTYKTNTESMESMQGKMDKAMQKLDQVEESQRSVMDALGGSLTQMTDGWAQQIIQENKATAFTVSTKIAVIEEMQSKRQAELEENIGNAIHKYVDVGIDKMLAKVETQTLQSTERLFATIEASKNTSMMENSQMQAHLTQMIKDMNQDCSKHVEAGMGVFGNSLRAQLDQLQAQQMAKSLEYESNIGSKFDGMIARLQQQASKQTDQMNQVVETVVKDNMDKASKDQSRGTKELQTCIEDMARAQKDRHQDMYSMVTSVLEQSCGAKAKAEQTGQQMTMLTKELTGNVGGARDRACSDDGLSDCRGDGRPHTAFGMRGNGGTGGGRRGSSTSTGRGGDASPAYRSHGIMNSAESYSQGKQQR